jgi:hypothetical protein
MDRCKEFPYSRIRKERYSEKSFSNGSVADLWDGGLRYFVWGDWRVGYGERDYVCLFKYRGGNGGVLCHGSRLGHRRLQYRTVVFVGV